MDKFRQISTELLLRFVWKIGFSAAVSRAFFGRLPSNFVCELIFKRSYLEL